MWNYKIDFDFGSDPPSFSITLFQDTTNISCQNFSLIEGMKAGDIDALAVKMIEEKKASMEVQAAVEIQQKEKEKQVKEKYASLVNCFSEIKYVSEKEIEALKETTNETIL